MTRPPVLSYSSKEKALFPVFAYAILNVHVPSLTALRVKSSSTYPPEINNSLLSSPSIGCAKTTPFVTSRMPRQLLLSTSQEKPEDPLVEAILRFSVEPSPSK